MCEKDKKMRKIRQILWILLSLPLLAFSQTKTNADEWSKIRYELQTSVVASVGENVPFRLVSNRHGLSSLESNNANLGIGIYRSFDKRKGFNWAYGAEIIGAWNYTSPLIVQQLYTDVKYNCWELSLGSKERWSEGKHRTLSSGGLAFAPNARPIPQIRFGINEYTTVPWWFDEWVKVKGHFSYGRYTDDEFQKTFTNNVVGTSYSTGVLFHEKTAFLRIANPSGKGLGWESGLEMYTKFGGDLYVEGVYRRTLPSSFMEYVKAFIPMPGGKNSPGEEQVNINGNVLGSWHAIMDYTTDRWKLRAYYEHFFEDHSQMLGVSWVSDREGVTRFLSYHPWQDGLWGLELQLPKGKWVKGVVAEYITSRDQSGPLLHNTNANFKEQLSGGDNYYNHSFYQSWQHWGMAMCNPFFLSPNYNENNSLFMRFTRIRACHIGIEGNPSEGWEYRLLGSYVHHWGTYTTPLVNPEGITSTMLEIAHTPAKSPEWQIVGTIAVDYSNLIGNNVGGMVTLKKNGFLTR